MTPNDDWGSIPLAEEPDDGDLGFEDMELSFDGDLDTMGFEEIDPEEDGFDDLDLGAELLFTESDISAVAFDYYNNVKAVQEKMQPPSAPAVDNFKISSADFPYLDTRFIEPLRLAILDQAKKQSELRENARMSAEDNAEEVFNTLSSALPFHVGAYYNTFIDMCARKYESFLKLVTVSTAQATAKFEHLLDKDKLSLSQFVFELNGLLWHQVTIHLGDERISRDSPVNYMGSNGKPVYNCGIIGNAMEAYNEYLKSTGSRPVEINSLTVGQLIDCVNFTLSAKNMAGTLHLAQDDVMALSTGELLRRYVLLEKEEDMLDLSDFKPVFKEFNSVTASEFERCNVAFSQDSQEFMQQLMPLYMFLCTPFYREGRTKINVTTDSITHEVLYYIYLILERGIADYKSSPRVSYEYLMMLTKFMVSLMFNAPYVRPVVYFTPNPVAGEDGEFDLNFYLHGKYYSAREHGLLINVLGDQRSAYLIPFVSVVDKESRNVTCQDIDTDNSACPPCVIFPLHRLFTDLQGATKSAGAASKKLKIEGSTEYCYTPSLAWVVSRSYSSQKDIDEAHAGEQRISRTSNPLLKTLLTYTNKFAPERFAVTAGSVTTDTGLTALYIQEKRDGTVGDATRLVSVLQGDTVISHKGTLGFDESDGALIMRFFRDSSGEDDEGQSIIAEQEHYSVEEFASVSEQKSNMPPIGSFIRCEGGASQYFDVLPELRSINKRLCALNALEYEEELEEVRLVIMRDLKNVTVNYHLDTLLAYGLLLEYGGLIKPGDDVDPVNFESLKALIHIVMGPVPELDEKTRWDEGCRTFVFKAIAASKISVSDLCIYLDQYDVNVIALQGLSNSETANAVDRGRYMALHALPDVHIRLRSLEERMLLLRILNEIGPDVSPVLRKRSPVLTAYNDVTTADTLDDVESSLKSGMKGGKQFDAFPLTRKVLGAEVGGSTPILKYFALERNVHGIMATAAYSDDEQEKEIYERLYESLGLGAEGMPQILQMDERAFMSAPFAISLETACSNNRGLLLRLIERGLLADTSARVDLHVIKAYDLILSYGTSLFEMRGPDAGDRYIENFEDVSEYLDYFYTYVGSFLVSYCFLQDEAVMAEATSSDRVVAFRESPTGFMHSEDMSRFAIYDLVDMRTVISD